MEWLPLLRVLRVLRVLWLLWLRRQRRRLLRLWRLPLRRHLGGPRAFESHKKLLAEKLWTKSEASVTRWGERGDASG